MDTPSLWVQSPQHPRPSLRERGSVHIGGLALVLAASVLFAGLLQRIASAQTTEASSVPLLYPSAVAFDSAGNLYLAETNRHVIDKIDASGKLTVIAGDGTQGFSGDSGPAIAAQLDSPQGLAADGSGNLYIVDTHNHRIRMVTAATGILTTVAGTGTAGFSGDGGSAAAASLNLPSAVAVDGSGNVYIADANNHRIRMVAAATGVITTVAGNGTQGDSGDTGAAVAASIDTPSGLAVDASGNLYLADSHSHRVRRVAYDSGIITTVAGGGTALQAGPATGTVIRLPRGLSLDSSGNLYVTDTNANQILKVAADGTLSLAAGTGTQGFSGDGGAASAALLDSPRGAAVSAGGVVAIADTGNQRLREASSSGTVQTLGGVGPAAPGSLILTAPSVVQYGTGSIAAMLAFGAAATGSVSFLEVVAGIPAALGSQPLVGGVARFSTDALQTGAHSILATYGGDATRPSVQSAIFLLTVTPAPVAATAMPATALYGQRIPAITGSIAGVLARDSSLVSVAFSTEAHTLSPAGTYPVTASLSGQAAPNYQLSTVSAGTVVIGHAPTVTSISASATTVTQGSTTTLSGRAASTTAGIPTGRLSFLDTGAPMGSATIDARGNASLTTTLGPGDHALSAAYSGDANFLSSASALISEVVAPAPANAPDFTLAASGATGQTITAGAQASFAFGVTIQNGPLNSPIQLTAGGLPPGATATFSPAYLPPGGAVPTFTLTIQTVKATADLRRGARPESGWPIRLLGAMLLAPLTLGRRRNRVAPFALGLCLLGGAGCGDRIAQLPAAPGPMATGYSVLVTGTSTLPGGAVLQHTVPITVTVQ